MGQGVRVMLLIQRMESGGAQVLVRSLASGLSARGWQPVVCCWGEGGFLLEGLEQEGVEVRCLNLGRSTILNPLRFSWDVARALFRLSRLARRDGIRLIHSHLHESNLLATLVAKAVGCPVVVTVHNVQMTPLVRRAGSLRSRLRLWAIRRALRAADIVVAVGNHVAQATRQLLPGAGGRLVVIHNGVSVRIHAVDRAAVRAKLGFNDSESLLVCVARLVPQKRHRDLIRALTGIVREEPMVRLLLVGTGPEERSLRALAVDCGVEEHVHWLGERRDVSEILAAADLFVLPSAFEGVPLALLEAMAAGLPVVVTDVPGSSEVVENGVSGLCVPPRSPEALAAAILRLLRRPDEARRLAEAGASEVRERFDVDSMIDGVDALYRRVLGEVETGR
jgi:glycosyltransferase involved in cell wall biosynthesis